MLAPGWSCRYCADCGNLGGNLSFVSAEELQELVARALTGQGMVADDAQAIAEEFVAAELAGVRTHGVTKLISLNLGDLEATPRIVRTGVILSVDGAGGNGLLLMRRLVPLVRDLCEEHGMAAALAHNFSRYGSLWPYTRLLAQAGLVGVLMNSAGPPAVAPYGSTEPLTGTNPICFSFPLPNGEAQTFDLSTAEMVWGQIRQAAVEDRELPEGPFLDASGAVTTAPGEVNAVRAFGGPKGFALNLAIEILAGLLPGALAGNDVESEFGCGAALLAIKPSSAGARDTFDQEVARLFDSVRACRPEDPEHPVRCPGDAMRTASGQLERSVEVEVSDVALELLRHMASGKAVSDLPSDPLFN